MAPENDIDLSTRFEPVSRSRMGEARTALRMWGGTLPGGVTYSVLGNAFYLLAQFGILSSLAHLRGPAAVGQFGLALALTTPLFFMSNMGLRTAQAVDVGEQFSFAEYGGVRVALTCLAVVLCLAVGLGYSSDHQTMLVIAVVTVARAFDSISNLAYGAFQQVGRMDLMARSYCLRGSITLVLFVAMLLCGADLAVALLVQVVVWATAALLLDYPAASRLTTGGVVLPRWTTGRSWRLIWKSAPLSGANFANSLQESIPRLYIEHKLGLEALGIFTAVSYFLRAGIVLSNSVSQAIVSRLARLVRQNDRSGVCRVLFPLAAVFLLLSVAGPALCYYFGDDILFILFNFRYESAAMLLFLISICIGIRMISSLSQSLMMAQQRFSYVLMLNILSLALIAVAGYYCISEFGMVGAGYTLIGAAALRLLFLEGVGLCFGGPSLRSLRRQEAVVEQANQS